MLSRLKNRFVSRGALSAVQDDAVVSLPGTAQGDILLVPAEQVLTFAVALPLPSHRKRIEALPFAIEDRIARPTDDVHMALSSEAADGAYLANVVDPALMARWIDQAIEAGLGTAAIMPDALALPLPAAGRWTVLRQPGGRVLVRLGDGRGFAAGERNFIQLWTVAGKPDCDEIHQFPDPVALAIDLRQGDYAAARDTMSLPLRRLATVAAVGLLAHGAIAAADMVLLKSVEARRGVELQAQLAASVPGAQAAASPAEAALFAARILPAGSLSPPGEMIPLLGRASEALAPMQGALSYKAISYAEQGDRLRIDVDAADPASLDRARQALSKAGLPARVEGGTILVGGGVR